MENKEKKGSSQNRKNTIVPNPGKWKRYFSSSQVGKMEAIARKSGGYRIYRPIAQGSGIGHGKECNGMCISFLSNLYLKLYVTDKTD